MQISVIPGESSAGGKRRIKIHGRRRWIAELSRVSATTVSSNCIFRRALQPGIAALGIPGIEWIPRYLLRVSILRVFSPGNKVLSVVAKLTYARVRRCHFSRCTLLPSVIARRSAAGEMHLFMFRRFSFKARRHESRKCFAPLCHVFSLACKQVGAHVRGYALNKSRSVLIRE